MKNKALIEKFAKMGVDVKPAAVYPGARCYELVIGNKCVSWLCQYVDVSCLRVRDVNSDSLYRDRPTSIKALMAIIGEANFAEYNAKKAEIEAEQVETEEVEEVEEITEPTEPTGLDSVKCKEVTPYEVTAKFADINKNNTIDLYCKQVENGEYDEETVTVAYEVTLSTKQWNEFNQSLLTSRDWLAGGIEDAVLVSCGWASIVVDTSGYGYARYVGLDVQQVADKHHHLNLADC